jgi:hypothetical protein
MRGVIPMHRAYRIALAAGTLLGKAALGFLVLMGILAMVAPPPELGVNARPDLAGSVANVSTVTLRVPEGELSGTLNVVDASGRELALLTYFSDGEMVLVARRNDGAAVSLWIRGEGTARVQMGGTSRATTIEMEPDGTTRTLKTGA